jgi:hypothetical protein
MKEIMITLLPTIFLIVFLILFLKIYILLIKYLKLKIKELEKNN